eukprot:TRINITY_DN57599_c0_g1_i1.p1 TRINITY_DN57599_c0_g1~~TRINITY_DN57599_c0_g1_i1.p1  ORF type:complete len:199 (-),score=36.83 TRINITY_DN57599_c0_g1_i1:57-653(-)
MSSRVHLPGISYPPTLTEERVRVLRRLEHTANARSGAGALNAHNFVFRHKAKEGMATSMRELKRGSRMAKEERIDRWEQKTEAHPFHNDQWGIDEQIYKANRSSESLERAQIANSTRRAKDAYGAILSRAFSETDVLAEIRKEKRTMALNEKMLKGLRDCEKSNMRASKVLTDRKRAEALNQQRMLHAAMSQQATSTV